MFGLLNLNKPPGVTSRDVVNQVQRLVRPHKVGHAGTLDPLATGVLIVCVGQATRLIEYVQQLPKHYVGAFLLGQRSPTEDIEGTIEELTAAPVPQRSEIESLLPQFTGSIQQVPPAFSALKVRGQRAYELARAGKTVDLAARTVMIHELAIVDYAYPELKLSIRCGSGTYVRSLGRDIARALGTDAVMSMLERRAIGEFRVEEAIRADLLTAERLGQSLLPPQAAVSALPALTLSQEEVRRLHQGQWVADRFHFPGDEATVFSSSNCLVAIVKRVGSELKPTLCFPPTDHSE